MQGVRKHLEGEPEKPTRLADVARACGLAQSTVSSALSGTGTISPKTRQRVIEAAKELGYKPNLHAATLAYASRGRGVKLDVVPIAVLFTGEEQLIGHWSLRSWFEDQDLSSRQFSISLHNLDKVGSLRGLSRRLYNCGVQGVVLSRMLTKPDLEGFEWHRFSVVQEGGRCLPDWPFDQVRVSPANTLRYLLRLALKRGYRRPGCFLYTHRERLDDDEIRLGEALAFNALSVKNQPVPPHVASFDDLVIKRRFKPHRAAMMDWYEKHLPDCVIGFNTAPYYMLRYCGVDIPGEVGYLANALSEFDAQDAPITGLWREQQLVAGECVDRLMYLVTHSRKGIPEKRRTIIVDPGFNEGTTLPQRRF